jgi:hypothetical protein
MCNPLPIMSLHRDKGKCTAHGQFPNPIFLQHVEQIEIVTAFRFFSERDKRKRSKRVIQKHFQNIDENLSLLETSQLSSENSLKISRRADFSDPSFSQDALRKWQTR